MNDKEELLSKAYTLRAGLSWISQQRTEIDRIGNSVAIPESVNEERVLKEYKQRIAGLEGTIEQVEQERVKAVQEANDFPRTEPKSFKGFEYTVDWWWLLCLAVFLVTLAVSAWVVYSNIWQPMSEGDDFDFIAYSDVLGGLIVPLIVAIVSLSYLLVLASDNGFVYVFLPVFSLFLAGSLCGFAILFIQGNMVWSWFLFGVAVLSFVGFLCYFIRALKLHKEHVRYNEKIRNEEEQIEAMRNSAEEKAKKEREKLLKRLLLAKKELEEAKTVKIPQLKEQYQADLAEAQRKIAENGKTQAVLAEHANNFYNTLVKEFGKMLDVRDWSCIDLIIYYFETNRAESIREALQLVDRERQTQQIVASMRMAAREINNSITTQTKVLEQALEYGFSQLESSIDSMERSFNQRIASLQSGVESLQSGVTSLQSSVEYNAAQTRLLASAQISQASLTNALLEKSNSTSEKLMNDVHYIRERYYN